jgi:hypothetical protein
LQIRETCEEEISRPHNASVISVTLRVATP